MGCDTHVNKGYMNELRPNLNERILMIKMSKKCSKEIKVTTFIDKMHLPIWWFDHRNPKVKRVLLRAIICWMTF